MYGVSDNLIVYEYSARSVVLVRLYWLPGIDIDKQEQYSVHRLNLFMSWVWFHSYFIGISNYYCTLLDIAYWLLYKTGPPRPP